MKVSGIKHLLLFCAALSLLHGARTAEERWTSNYQAKGVFADYEHRLIWQDDASLADWKMDFAQAEKHCRKLKLAGSDGWRLPTIDELQRLYADSKGLKHTERGSYWSSTPLQREGRDYVQGARYPGGKVGRANASNALLVRCVRDGAETVAPAKKIAASPKPDRATVDAEQKAAAKKRAEREKRAREDAVRQKAERERLARQNAEKKRLAEEQAERERLARAQAERAQFELLKTVAVMDAAGRAWQDDADNTEKQLSWDQASQYCASLALADYNDWRLPTPNELESLYGHRGDLKHLANNVYWTSGEKKGDDAMAEYVHFGNGSHFWSFKTREFNVRCVRSTAAR